MRYLQLGASLYVPSTRSDLVAIGNRLKHAHLRSVIYCTEDAIDAADVPRALDQLACTLPRLQPCGLLRYVRVRNPAVLRSILRMDGIRHLHGFVLPKVTLRNLDDYFSALGSESAFEVMPTLETVEVFDPMKMVALRNRLLEDRYRSRIVSLRIGGNDLIGLLGLRRRRDRTLYTTPLGATIVQLVTTFRPHGFNLTAPVFEYLSRYDVLRREVKKDLGNGLFGKTAIHPGQVPVIEKSYQVSRQDLQTAELILEEKAPPIFRLFNAMCEPATQRIWAQHITERARLYGVRGSALVSRNGTHD